MIRVIFFVFILGTALTRSLVSFPMPLRKRSLWDFKAPPPQNLTPMEAMVDLTNKLGIVILQHYSYSKVNFAFSPYGLASTLVVLYEGAKDESAKQIREGVNFPSERHVLRQGFRDIHKRLESYFSLEEFSSGIAFSRKNTKLKPEYKNILKIYGYKFDSKDSLHGGNDESDENDENDENDESDESNENDENDENEEIKPDDTLNECPENSKRKKEGKMVCETKETVPNKKGNNRRKFIDPNSVTTTIKTVRVTNKENDKDGSTVTTTEASITTTEGPVSTDEKNDRHVGIDGSSITTTEGPVSTDEKSDRHVGIDGSSITTTEGPVSHEEKSDRHVGTDGSSITTTEGPVSTDEKNDRHVGIDGSSITTTEGPVSTDEKSDRHVGTDGSSITTTEGPVSHEEKSDRHVGTDGSSITTTEGPVSTDEKSDRHVGTDGSSVTTTEGPVSQEEKSDRHVGTDGSSITTTEGPVSTDEKSDRHVGTDGSSITTTEGPVSTEEKESRRIGKDWSSITTTEETVICKMCDLTTISPTFTTPQTGSDEESGKESLTTVGRRYSTQSYQGTTREGSINNEIIKNVLNSLDNKWDRHINNMLISHGLKTTTESERKPVFRSRRSIDGFKHHKPPLPRPPLQFAKHYSDFSKKGNIYKGLPMHMFLSRGLIDIPIPMMTFTDTFRFGYIRKLHAKALELPLDDSRYKLMIVLPLERRGLRQLIFDLNGNSVKDIVKVLKPTRVRAIVPPFTADNVVNLTSGVQMLGIRDVFDPHKANLSGMSFDPELYVQNIEQSVTVLIKDYGKTSHAQDHKMEICDFDYEFTATHPFLYFVLDSELDVILMIGQMFNPNLSGAN